MRIPNSLDDDLSSALNGLHREIGQRFMEAVTRFAAPQKVNVMLGDASVSQQETFDPQNVKLFLEGLAKSLRHWSPQGVERTDTDDLRRLHLRLTSSVDTYEVSCYMALQYHALPFYRCDARVTEIKKRIVALDEKIAKTRTEIEERQNKELRNELGKRGMADLGFEQMLEAMYNDEKLFAELAKSIGEIERSYPEYYGAKEETEKLQAELSKMIIEVYRTKLVPLDHNKLMQGEEGAAVYFDIEEVSRKGKDGNISLHKITAEHRKAMTEMFGEVGKALAAV